MSLDILPVEWLLTELNQVLSVKNGYAFKSKDYISEKTSDDLVPVIRISDIKDNSVSTLKSVFVEKAKASENFKIDKGDLLIAMSGATTGKTGIFREENPAFLNQRVGNLKVHSQEYFLPKFRNFLIQNLSNQILENAYGGAQPNISSKDIESLKFGLPSLAEQQEIVRQLDVMLAQVEQIKARLDAIPAILKKFRQSVLADAVSGKLLDGAVESSIYSVKDIFEITSGIAFKKSEYTEDGYKLLQIANVSHGKTKWETLNFVSEQNAKQFDNCVLKSGDVVIALNRPITHDLLKIAKITEQDLPAILYQRVACLRIKDKELVDSEFLFLSMQTMSFRKVIEAKLRGSDQPYLNTSDLGNLTINLIPLNEQKQTLEKIGVLLSKSNQIEAVVQLAQKRVNLFTQSILAKAFSGELTAEWREQHQDLITGVNSAEALLAKIQAEREASKPVKKAKKVK